MLKRFTRLDGFSLNVSGYESLDKCNNTGLELATATNLKYIVDTSRNGNGNPHPGKWCNVTDTKIGLEPRLIVGSTSACYAYMWLKIPGESDGLGIKR